MAAKHFRLLFSYFRAYEIIVHHRHGNEFVRIDKTSGFHVDRLHNHRISNHAVIIICSFSGKYVVIFTLEWNKKSSFIT